jgi:hypothetical protein
MSMGEFAIAFVTLLLVLVGVPLAIEAIRRNVA